jgi:ATP adenylyltransferase
MKHNNLWAPWRTEYLKSLVAENPDDESPGCFLCAYWNDPTHDEKNLVLWRTRLCQVVFNRFPYTGGHLLIAPAAHVGDLNQLDEAALLEMMLLARQAQTVIQEAIKPEGFNLGINMNQCAGAGLPDHVHMHLVPRWVGDTNFMAVTGQIRIISQGLDELYQQFKEISQKLNLPQVPK